MKLRRCKAANPGTVGNPRSKEIEETYSSLISLLNNRPTPIAQEVACGTRHMDRLLYQSQEIITISRASLPSARHFPCSSTPLFRFLERKLYSHVELAVFYESALEIVRLLASILIFYYGHVNVPSVEGCS